ncbi:MAG: hypothetical protein ACTSO8_06920 [Promethearchaeota archaeon]
MPYIVGTMRYPSHKQLDIAKRWIKISGKYPDDDTMAVQICAPVTTDENGIIVMGIYDVKEGQLKKAFTVLSSMFYEYIDIEGYEYTVRIWSTFEEALAIAGIQAPE